MGKPASVTLVTPLLLSVRTLPISLKRYFQVSTPSRMVVLETGGPLKGAKEVHLLECQVML